MDFKKLFMFLLAALVGFAPASAATIANFAITDVDYEDGIAPGATMPVTITLENSDAAKDFEDITVKAWLEDADSELIGDKYKTTLVQVHQDSEKEISFDISIPTDAEEGKYTLVIQATGEWEKSDTKLTTEWTGVVEVEQADDSLTITEMQLSAETANAGDSIDVAVTVLNNGLSDEENVKVRTYLGSAEASVVIPLFKEADEQTVYMTLQLPKDLSAGIETIKAQAYNAFASASASKDIVIEPVKIVSAATTPTQAAFSVQTIPAGKASVFSLQITNNGAEPKTYNFAIGGVQDWASNARVDPSSATLGAGETATVQVHLIPTAGGEHAFALFVKDGAATVATQIIKTNVSGAPIQATGSTAAYVVLAAVILLAIAAYYRGSNISGKKLYY